VLLRDGERACAEIDVGPAEIGELAAPETGVKRRRPESDQPIVGHRVEEALRLLRCPDRHLVRLTPRRPYTSSGVHRDQIPAHCVGERTMKDPVSELHRGDRQRAAVLATTLEQLPVPPLHVER